jgi:hypothetical protein
MLHPPDHPPTHLLVPPAYIRFAQVSASWRSQLETTIFALLKSYPAYIRLAQVSASWRSQLETTIFALLKSYPAYIRLAQVGAAN